jgi:hypothetical protein
MQARRHDRAQRLQNHALSIDVDTGSGDRAHAHVKTDKIDAGTLASLHAAGYLPEIWTPDESTERLRRLVAHLA